MSQKNGPKSVYKSGNYFPIYDALWCKSLIIHQKNWMLARGHEWLSVANCHPVFRQQSKQRDSRICTSKKWWNSTVKSNSPSTHLPQKIIMKSYVSILFIISTSPKNNKQASSFCCISVAECNQPPPCRGSKPLSSLDHKGGPQRHCRYCLGTTSRHQKTWWWWLDVCMLYMGVSNYFWKHPQSSILMGFSENSIMNHPFWGRHPHWLWILIYTWKIHTVFEIWHFLNKYIYISIDCLFKEKYTCYEYLIWVPFFSWAPRTQNGPREADAQRRHSKPQ